MRRGLTRTNSASAARGENSMACGNSSTGGVANNTVLAMAITTPAVAAQLAEAVRALPEETMNYKSLKAYGSALLAWLDTQAAQASH